MASQTRKITLDTAALIFGRGVGFLLGLVRLNYLARLLGVSNFGLLNFATYFTSLFAFLFDIGLSQLLTREIARDPLRSRQMLGQVLVLKLGIAVLAFALVVTVALLSGFEGDTFTAILLTTIALAVNQIGASFLAALQAHRKMALVSASNIVNDAVLSAAIILLLPGSPKVATALSLTAVIALLNLTLLFLVYVRIAGMPILRSDISTSRALLREGIPIALSALGISLYTFIGPTVLKYTRGEAEVGLFSSGYKLIMILTAIPSAFTQVLFPIFSEFFAHAKEKLEKSLTDALRVISLVSLPIAAGTLVVGNDLFRHLYTEEYLPGVFVLQVILLSNVFGHMAWILYSFLLAVDRQRFLVWLTLINGCAAALLSLIVVPAFGYRSLPLLTAVVDVSLFVCQIVYVRRLGYRSLHLRQLVRPAAAAGAMAAVLSLVSPMNLFVAVAFGALLYGLGLLLVGALGDQERQILRAVSARIVPRRDPRTTPPPES